MSIGGPKDSWRQEEIGVRSEGFLNDIKKNVSDLEETIGRGVLIDHEFVQILLQDIEDLKDVYSRESKFTQQVRELDHLSQRVLGTLGLIMDYQEQVEKAKNTDDSEDRKGEKSALVGELSQPSSLPIAKEYQEGARRLDLEYNVRRIRPDGHCMFRSYVVGLIGGQYNKAELKERLQNLAEKNQIPKSSLSSLLESLDSIASPGMDETVLQDQKKLDEWVFCCRQLVGNMIVKKLDTVSEKELKNMSKTMRNLQPKLREIQDDREVIKKYAKGISSMEKKWYGGELELRLLDECLGTESVELNVSKVSISDLAIPKTDNPRAIFLFIRAGDHVDVAFPVKR